MESINLISGLSPPKAAQHLLQGTVRELSKKIWTKVNQAKTINECSSIFPLLQNAIEIFSAILWNEDSTISALNESSVTIDVIRIIAIHFLCATHLDSSSLSDVTMESALSACLKALVIARNDKDLDDIVNLLPCVLRLFCTQLNGQWGVSGTTHFLSKLLETATLLCESYSNRKKLFILGCEVAVAPCLQTVLQLQLCPSEASPNLQTALGSLLGRCLFEEAQIVEDIARVSLESLSRAEVEVGGGGGGGDTGRKRRKAQGGGSKKRAPSGVFAYHAGVYQAVSSWVVQAAISCAEDGERDGEGEGGCEATGRAVSSTITLLFTAFLHTSMAIAHSSTADSVSTFTVRWRQHVKRVLHLGLGLEHTFSRDCAARSSSVVFDYVMLTARKALVNCMNSGLSGSAGGSGGAMPNHESLDTYLLCLQTMAKSAAADATSTLHSLKEECGAEGGVALMGTADVPHRVRMAAGHLGVMRSLLGLDCRVVSEQTLPHTLRNLCMACDLLQKALCPGDNNTTGSSDASASLAAECRVLFLDLLNLHGELRQLDVFLTAVLREVRIGRSDKSFDAILLSTEETQRVLWRWFGGMPARQRHSCWESLHEALVAGQVGFVDSESCGATYIRTACALIRALGLSGDIDYPVPPVVITAYLIQVGCHVVFLRMYPYMLYLCICVFVSVDAGSRYNSHMFERE